MSHRFVICTSIAVTLNASVSLYVRQIVPFEVDQDSDNDLWARAIDKYRGYNRSVANSTSQQKAKPR